MNHRYAPVLLVLAGLATMLPAARARALRPDSILGTELDRGTLTEYTPTGSVLQTTYVPPPVRPWPFEDVRDTVVDAYGNVQIFHGTFEPYLTTWNPGTGSFSHHTAPGWGIVNNGSYGGVAAFGQYVYAPTMHAGGIIRFDIANGYRADRPVTDGDFMRLTMGWDALLYALPPDWRLPEVGIRVFDPSTMALLRTVHPNLPFPDSDVRGIAVNAHGEMYLATWYGAILRLDPQGRVIQRVQTQSANFNDIDLSGDGRVVLGAFSPFGGRALIGDAGLTNLRPLGPNPDFVAFSRSPASIPEPGTVALLAIAALPVVARRRRSASEGPRCRVPYAVREGG